MTHITQIDPTASDAKSSASVKILGKDDFLNMLIAQLQHQDPLNPADSTEFTAQLAQFSSLEQLSNIHDSLENMEQFQASLTHSQAVSYIGKEITAAGSGLHLRDGQTAACHFELEANAAMTAVSIYDAAGGFVNSFETGPLSPGRQSVIWDGTDFNGNQMPAGAYSFEIQAVDASNENVMVRPLMSAIVTGVSFKDKTAYLMTELQSVALDDVVDVLETSPPAAPVTTPTAAISYEHTNGGL
ncbi:MAG: flagellar hook capping FlgD N-terminal domain-containing protein [Desulfobacterales bacterium]|jgi:flagellar basal-body rod modification protein FlgD